MPARSAAARRQGSIQHGTASAASSVASRMPRLWRSAATPVPAPRWRTFMAYFVSADSARSVMPCFSPMKVLTLTSSSSRVRCSASSAARLAETSSNAARSDRRRMWPAARAQFQEALQLSGVHRSVPSVRSLARESAQTDAPEVCTAAAMASSLVRRARSASMRPASSRTPRHTSASARAALATPAALAAHSLQGRVSDPHGRFERPLS